MRTARTVRWCIALFALLLSATVPATTAAAAQQCVLVVHSYHHGFTWSDSVSRGIAGVLDPQVPELSLRFEFLDVRHRHDPASLDRFADLLQAKYSPADVDVVICVDDAALQVMLGRGRAVLPDVPLVFCSISGYRPEMREGRQVTGLRESIAIAETLELALDLHPDTREVNVLLDDSQTGKALHARAEEAFAPFTDRVTFRYLTDHTVEDLQDLAPLFPADSIVFLFIFGPDRQGRVLSHEHQLDRLREHCPVPVYSIWDFYLGHGVVGGRLVDGELEGAMAAQLARRVLAGEPASSIPLETSPTRYKFDWSELQRFDVDAAALPSGSVVTGRPYSVYRAYRMQIWMLTVVLLVLAGLSVALMINVSLRRRVELDVRARERTLRAVFEGATDVGFVLADATDPAMPIREFSPGAERMFGYTRAEVLGRSVAMLHTPEDAARLPAIREGLIQAGSGMSGELSLVRKGGERFTAWMVTHPLSDDEGNVTGGLGVTLDITDRKLAEERHARLETQLRQSQRMEAVGQLAGGVAHDFNNLLQVITGYGEMASEEVSPDSRINDQLQEILKAGHRAKALVSQLLVFSRRQVLEMADLDLAEVVADVATMLRSAMGEHIELRVVPAGSPVTVRADRGQLDQMLTNLCLNARDAMPDGGTVSIETANVRLDDAFCEANVWARPGRYVRLTVADTGTGMDEKTVARIFEPFFTTKEVGKGTGLGLATVYGMVRQHDGLMHVESEPGRGTTFLVFLPRSEHSPVTAEQRAETTAPGGTETILLAEDDDSVRRLGRAVLERAGYQVLTAVDGKEALAVFAEQADDVDLAILDLVMPGLGGHAVCERMRAERPDLKVLFCSGYSPDTGRAETAHVDGVERLQKPYQQGDLLRTVREVLDGS